MATINEANFMTRVLLLSLAIILLIFINGDPNIENPVNYSEDFEGVCT